MQLSLSENQLRITIEEEQSTDEIFQYFQIGRKTRYQYYQKGILVNNQICKQNHALKPNDLVMISLPDEADTIPIEKIDIEIIYEDDIFLIVNKPAFLLVHSDGTNTSHTLYNRVAWYYQKQQYPYCVRAIHRLDYETSGLVLFCKRSFFQPLLDAWLSEKKIYREYDALCEGILKRSQLIDKPIGRDRHDARKMRISPTGKPSITHVSVQKHLNQKTLVRCVLETGRTHQIRVHMASIGHPLVNDSLYGRKSKTRMYLHACRLTFVHPLTNEMKTVECPSNFKDWK